MQVPAVPALLVPLRASQDRFREQPRHGSVADVLAQSIQMPLELPSGHVADHSLVPLSGKSLSGKSGNAALFSAHRRGDQLLRAGQNALAAGRHRSLQKSASLRPIAMDNETFMLVVVAVILVGVLLTMRGEQLPAQHPLDATHHGPIQEDPNEDCSKED